VGFPGETDADFRDTLAIVDEVGYASSFFFKYSPRPGTPAAELADQVPESVKSDRLHRLQRLVEAHQARFNTACVGRRLDILFEKPARDPGQLVGRSPYLQPVHVIGPSSLIGEIAPVTITGVGRNSLFGTLEATIQTREAMPAGVAGA
jgi:tRNA-2-methylthio-N6-dimethylallyladenosine synthase